MKCGVGASETLISYGTLVFHSEPKKQTGRVSDT